VLYPNDSTPEGKELRLKQQYFFVSASLQVRRGSAAAAAGVAASSVRVLVVVQPRNWLYSEQRLCSSGVTPCMV
jgi:hypothetical protein